MESYSFLNLAIARASFNFILIFIFSLIYFTLFENFMGIKNCGIIILICVGGAIGFYLWLNGLSKILFSLAILSGITSQVLMQLISIFVLKEALQYHHIFGSLIALFGFVVFNLQSNNFTKKTVKGILFIVLANLVWALSYSGLSFVLKNNSALIVANIQELTVLLFGLILITLRTKNNQQTKFKIKNKIQFFNNVIIMSFVSSSAILLGLFVLSYTLLSVAATTNLLGPIFSMLLAYIALKEKFTFFQICGSFIVIIGVLLSNL